MDRATARVLVASLRNEMKDLKKFSQFRAGGFIGNGSKMPKNCISNKKLAKIKFGEN